MPEEFTEWPNYVHGALALFDSIGDREAIVGDGRRLTFAELRTGDAKGQDELMATLRALSVRGTPSSTGFKRLKEEVSQRAAIMYWRGHMDEDEMFYMTDSQARLETIRQFKANAGAASLKLQIKARQAVLEKKFDEPLGKFRHLFSAIAIPNFSRSFEVTAQRETEKRMTIVVIALKRYQLRHGSFPAALAELTPKFVAAELIDPWSGKPFHYRLNTNQTFTLYSVGADGQDDGGDPTPAKSTNAPPDVWAGKDVVWPTAVVPDQPKAN